MKVADSIVVKDELPAAFNKMPTPSGSQTEEEFIGKFMADKAMQTEFPDHKQRAAVAYEKWDESKNSAVNATPAVEVQAIETADVTLPIIFADVLTYAPGELGTRTEIGREGAKVYYTPEAISDPDFFETVMRAPYNVATHESNTGEFNKKADGWSREVFYDKTKNGTFAKGYIFGGQEVQYVANNKLLPGFGTSAYIKFLELKRQKGVAPNGEEYDAIATKISCSHVAILPNIRDSKNVIVAMNALTEQSDNKNDLTEQTTKSSDVKIIGKNAGGNMADENTTSKDVVKNTVKEVLNEEKEAEKTKTYNERLDKLEGMMAKMSAGKNGDDDELKVVPDSKKKEEEAANAEDKEEKELAKNALPSQDMLKDISDMTGLKVTENLSIKNIGDLLGIKGKSFNETLSAINAKRAEFKKEIPAATNSGGDKYGIDQFTKEI